MRRTLQEERVRHTRPTIVAGALLALTLILPATGPAAPQSAPAGSRDSAEYFVSGTIDTHVRNAVAKTGAVINSVDHGGLLNVTATPAEGSRLKALGLRVDTESKPAAPKDVTPLDFPPADSGYHTSAATH